MVLSKLEQRSELQARAQARLSYSLAETLMKFGRDRESESVPGALGGMAAFFIFVNLTFLARPGSKLRVSC